MLLLCIGISLDEMDRGLFNDGTGIVVKMIHT